MKLNEIEVGKTVSELVVRVISVAPARLITTRGGRRTQLTEVLIADETSTTILSVWGFGKGSSFSAGKVIKIEDGWVKEWQGKIQLSLGRSGHSEEVDDDGSIPSISEIAKTQKSVIPDK